MGKASIIYVIGLSAIIAYALMNMNRSSTDSMDSFSEYYGRSMAHNIAVTGANIGTQLLLSDNTYMAARTDSFGGGRYSLRVDSVNTKGDKRITVVSNINLFDNISEKSIIRDTVVAYFRHTPFSKYGYFSGSETNGYMSPTNNTTSGGNMWKITGDSLFGPAHTNGRFNLSGRPYFDDKVTATTAANLAVGATPVYNAGYQWGITVNRPIARLNDLENIAASSGKLFNGGADVGLIFISDGRVQVKIPWNTGTTRDTTYGSINALAPNGVIMVKSIDVRVSGTYHGQVTVGARIGTSAGSLKGNVWIQGNLVAADNPATNPNSTDIMGLVSERMTYVATTGIPRGAGSQTNIQAAIYCQNGVFAAERYNDMTLGLQGRVNLFGGAVMNASTSFGVMSGGLIVNGFLKSFRYDSRFQTQSPPYFPFSDKYELLSWWEK
ncbi:MAG: hypothetical protein HW412_45 [Bacteroidetes bacterium]|nr:hypothetical protein [Bacteroidota bacterium]